MHRIDTDTRDQDEFGAGKDGFTGGDPGAGIAPTDLSPDWCDAIQEELAGVVEDQDLALNKGDHGQLVVALRRMIQRLTLCNFLARASETTSGTPISWNQAILAPGTTAPTLVVVGDGGVGAYAQYSVDGRKWYEASGTIDALHDVALKGSQELLAVGGGGEVKRSTDGGASWSDASGSVPANTYYGVAYDAANGEWRFVGADDGSDAEIYKGTPGSWTAMSDPTGNTNNLNDVAIGNGYWVAVGDGGKLIYSQAPGGWSTGTSGTSENLNEVVYDPHTGKFIAVGDNGTLLVTDDPTGAWDGSAGPSTSDKLTSVAVDGAGAWVVTNLGSAIHVSFDGGQSWHKTIQYLDGVFDVAHVADFGWLVVGNSGGASPEATIHQSLRMDLVT